ncbi:MAG: polyketide cyclase [Planctomycetota bacterium]|nr:MAG: polyketide cyclase [Planctomycetota bacterium]
MREPREVVREWVQAIDHCDADRAASLYHEAATNLQVAIGVPAVGRQAIQEELQTFFTAFPDGETQLENLFQDGPWAMAEWRGRGTWSGEFAGLPANGKTFEIEGCGFFHIVDGKIKFQRGYWDRASFFEQLGIPEV